MQHYGGILISTHSRPPLRVRRHGGKGSITVHSLKLTVILCQLSPLLSPPRPLKRAKAPPAGPPSLLNTDLPVEPSPVPLEDDREV